MSVCLKLSNMCFYPFHLLNFISYHVFFSIYSKLQLEFGLLPTKSKYFSSRNTRLSETVRLLIINCTFYHRQIRNLCLFPLCHLQIIPPVIHIGEAKRVDVNALHTSSATYFLTRRQRPLVQLTMAPSSPVQFHMLHVSKAVLLLGSVMYLISYGVRLLTLPQWHVHKNLLQPSAAAPRKWRTRKRAKKDMTGKKSLAIFCLKPRFAVVPS